MIKLEKTVIGRIDVVDLPDLDLFNLGAKIDTGANRSSLHCANTEVITENGIDWLYFEVPEEGGDHIKHKTDKFFQKNIKSSSGHTENRYIIYTRVKLFDKLIETTFSLTNRDAMQYPVLLGRKLLKEGFLVDVTKKNLSQKFSKRNKKA